MAADGHSSHWDVGTFADDGNAVMRVTEAYLPDFHITQLRAQWPDGCSMIYQLTAEVLHAGGLTTKDRAILEMRIRHNGECPNRLHSPMCGTPHQDGPCPLCDVMAAKERITAMAGVMDHALIVPEWVAEWERRWREDQEQEATPSHQPAVRRYCALEG